MRSPKPLPLKEFLNQLAVQEEQREAWEGPGPKPDLSLPALIYGVSEDSLERSLACLLRDLKDRVLLQNF